MLGWMVRSLVLTAILTLNGNIGLWLIFETISFKCYVMLYLAPFSVICEHNICWYMAGDVWPLANTSSRSFFIWILLVCRCLSAKRCRCQAYCWAGLFKKPFQPFSGSPRKWSITRIIISCAVCSCYHMLSWGNMKLQKLIWLHLCKMSSIL